MVIVISESEIKPGEATLVNELFHAGLDVFHIRKYGIDLADLRRYISAIDQQFHDKLVLNHDHELGRELGLKRFHFSERDRLNLPANVVKGKGEYFSTSVHNVSAFNELSNEYDYAFLSPIFDSISKTDYKAVAFDLSMRKNLKTRLIGLGGITAANTKLALGMGFDGVALLGAIWKSTDPIKEFKQLKLIKES